MLAFFAGDLARTAGDFPRTGEPVFVGEADLARAGAGDLAFAGDLARTGDLAFAGDLARTGALLIEDVFLTPAPVCC